MEARRGLYPTKAGKWWGGPGTTRGLLCSSLGRFGSGAPLSSPAMCSRDIPAGLSQATAASSVAGYLRQWTDPCGVWQRPAARVIRSAQFCEDLPGLSAASPLSLEPPPWPCKRGWLVLLSPGRHFSIHRLPAQSSPQGPPCPTSLPLAAGCLPLSSSLSPLCQSLQLPSRSLGSLCLLSCPWDGTLVGLWGLSLCSLPSFMSPL